MWGKAARGGGEPRARALAAFFLGAGTLHFVIPRSYERTVPDYFPAHRELVYVSGVAEIGGALAILHPGARRLGGWWLVATLLAVFSANVNMALNPDRFRNVPPWALWARLPVQGVFVAWALWAMRAAR